jgi:hypothetical protein
MLECPINRKIAMARLRRLAINTGPLPVRTCERVGADNLSQPLTWCLVVDERRSG